MRHSSSNRGIVESQQSKSSMFLYECRVYLIPIFFIQELSSFEVNWKEIETKIDQVAFLSHGAKEETSVIEILPKVHRNHSKLPQVPQKLFISGLQMRRK